MVSEIFGVTKARGRLDEGASIKSHSAVGSSRQDFYIAASTIFRPGERTQILDQKFPCFNLSKKVEQHNSENNFHRILRSLFDDFLDDILAYFIEDAIYIAEEILLENVILGPSIENGW